MNTSSRVQNLTKAALGAVLICLGSWLVIPSTIPFTMQTFAVSCVLVVLGGRQGLASIAVYLLMGIIGLPVFSGFQGGIGHLLNLTGGYLIGFLFMGLFYTLFEGFAIKGKRQQIAVLGGGLLLCYLIGTLWFLAVSGTRDLQYTPVAVLSLCVFPYLIPDAAKLYLAVVLGSRIRKSLSRK